MTTGSNPAMLEYLDPIEEILVTWKAFAESVRTGTLWGDEDNERNVIIDAEALLTFMLPEMEIARLGFHSEDGVTLKAKDPAAGAAIAAVAGEKYSVDLPSEARGMLIASLLDFFETHGADEPSFSTGSYLEIDGTDQAEKLRAEVAVVDAYTFSLTLCLATLRLVDRWYRRTAESEDEARVFDRLRNLAMIRLTAALQGLVDSFVVAAFDISTWERQTKRGWPASSADLDAIRRRLRRIWPKTPQDRAFEIGWSWGPIHPSMRIHQSDRPYPHYADPAPYLYFTVGALDGINDLFSESIQASEMLNSEQQGLAQILRMYADLTERYWSAIALHETGGRWALENVPWSASDGDESEYWTLYLLRVALPRLAATQHDTKRLLDLVEELAQRSRITRAPVPAESDEALTKIHSPGLKVELIAAQPKGTESQGSDPFDGASLGLLVYDFSPQLLKLAGQLLGRVTAAQDRAELSALIGRIWRHIRDRRLDSGPGVYAWDTLEKVYPQWYDQHKDRLEARHREGATIGSWYLTERVIEGMVAVADGETARPLVPETMEDFLFELIAELEHRIILQDSKPQEDHASFKRKRRGIHEARTRLLAKDPSAAFERIIEVLAEDD